MGDYRFRGLKKKQKTLRHNHIKLFGTHKILQRHSYVSELTAVIHLRLDCSGLWREINLANAHTVWSHGGWCRTGAAQAAIITPVVCQHQSLGDGLGVGGQVGSLH